MTRLKLPTLLSLSFLPSLPQSCDGARTGLFVERWSTSGKTAPNASGSDALVVSNHAAIHQPGSAIQSARGYTAGLGGQRLPTDPDKPMLEKALERC